LRRQSNQKLLLEPGSEAVLRQLLCLTLYQECRELTLSLVLLLMRVWARDWDWPVHLACQLAARPR
jgi:hypothetical protein